MLLRQQEMLRRAALRTYAAPFGKLAANGLIAKAQLPGRQEAECCGARHVVSPRIMSEFYDCRCEQPKSTTTPDGHLWGSLQGRRKNTCGFPSGRTRRK